MNIILIKCYNLRYAVHELLPEGCLAVGTIFKTVVNRK